ncbi:uncharacterized protein SPSK_05684 [Sporothrix schenckii 1099-18]|uniref:Uncharacterized protein n=1 Tax=Sporothrix schenckii 1099-18 TaxID=1397361 RepID=A0A0F2LTN1_SPOSC|nr:uncharacterized protein SPSK_05684 [Sporothrix schenckii 1099-18]KJR80214.1 hypothetical protein SPSK_05684 [Sporothrix schenckii 1099-18]
MDPTVSWPFPVFHFSPFPRRSTPVSSRFPTPTPTLTSDSNTSSSPIAPPKHNAADAAAAAADRRPCRPLLTFTHPINSSTCTRLWLAFRNSASPPMHLLHRRDSNDVSRFAKRQPLAATHSDDRYA